MEILSILMQVISDGLAITQSKPTWAVLGKAKGSYAEKVQVDKKNLKSVQQLSSDGTVIANYSSIQKASEATGIGHSSIGKTTNGKQKTAGNSSNYNIYK